MICWYVVLQVKGYGVSKLGPVKYKSIDLRNVTYVREDVIAPNSLITKISARKY